MKKLALIVFLYYTSVWAIVSTLVVFVTRHLKFSAVTLGWLLSGYGFATMVRSLPAADFIRILPVTFSLIYIYIYIEL
jgi:hypothetical protein